MQNCQVNSILRNIPTLHKIGCPRGLNALPQPAEKPAKTLRKPNKKIDRKRIGTLAEAVILQSIEDLSNKTNRKKSVEFFMGEGFSLCADMAGMPIVDRLRLLRLLRKFEPGLFYSRHAKKVGSIVNLRP